VLSACLAATALWGVTLGLRSLLDATSWGAIIGILALIGIAYLGLQYLFLREHLTEKSEA